MSDYAGRGGRGRTPTITVALIGNDAAAHDEIVTVLAKIPEPVVEVVKLSGGGESRKRPPEIVIITLDDDEATWALQIQEIREAAPHAGVIGALPSTSGGRIRPALRAGADDVFFLPVEFHDLSRCLVRSFETLRGGRTHSATICSVASVAGGVGVSSLVIALGLALNRREKRVALIDLSLQSGTLAAMLDLTPQATINELVDPTSTLDSLRLESSLVAHKSGLYLLAAPKRIEESEMVSVTTITAVLEVMRELFDFILIDCGHHMNEALIAAWEQSAYLLYVIQQSLGSIRPAQRFLEMFERLQLTGLDPQFVLNCFDPASPFSDDKIATALRRPIAAHLPRDNAAFLQLQLECTDLAQLAPKSPSRFAIDELAARLSGFDTASTTEKSPFLGRLRAIFKGPDAGLRKPLPARDMGHAKPSPADA